MLNASHLEAAIPKPFWIFGLKLKPFCIGHYWLLSHTGSTVLSDNPLQTTREELLKAVVICAQDFETGRELINDAALAKEAHKWAAKNKDFDLLEKFTLFAEYLKAGLVSPSVWEEDGREGGLFGCHWTEYLIVCLTAHLGYSESEAANMFLPKAQRLVAAFWEIKHGKRILLSEDDLKAKGKLMEAHERISSRVCRN